MDRRVPGAQVDMVRGDSTRGSYELTHYLLGLGHRRIALLGGPASLSVSHERLAGYQQAFEQAQLIADPTLCFFGEFTVARGQAMAHLALALTPLPTAIFAMNNFIAIGVLKALRQQQLRVPEDISVVSFDDLPDLLVVEPFLTVAAQPEYELGQRATQLLLQRITDPTGQPYQEIVLPTRLIIRHSCRAIPQ